MAIHMRGLCPLIQVFDMDDSLHFYCELLGFEIVEKSAGGGWAWLRHGTAELMLNTAYDEGDRPEKPDPARLLGEDFTLFERIPGPAPDTAHLLGALEQGRLLGELLLSEAAVMDVFEAVADEQPVIEITADDVNKEERRLKAKCETSDQHMVRVTAWIGLTIVSLEAQW